MVDLKSRYLIVRADKGSLLGLFKFLASSNSKAHESVERSEVGDGDGDEGWGPVPGDHRLVIVISIIIRRIISMFGKPMEWFGMVIEFMLNLLSLNGGIHGLILNLIEGAPFTFLFLALDFVC